MGQVLHESATTTYAIRAAIQRSKASLQALSERYGINPKTVAKWRGRTSLEDRPRGPSSRDRRCCQLMRKRWSSSSVDARILITGANRGIGRALVNEALRRGAARVYAGTRRALEHADDRVIPVTLDVTNVSQIKQVVDQIDTLDVLVNNAGVAIYDDLSNLEVIEQHLSVNLFGVIRVTLACLPLLRRSNGAIVTNASLAGLAALPVVPVYSLSKAAVFNLTQSYRALLAGQGVSVHAVVLGPVDTDMNRGFDVPKASPESAAQRIFEGLERGEDEFQTPRPAIADGWRSGVVKVERQFADCAGDAPHIDDAETRRTDVKSLRAARMTHRLPWRLAWPTQRLLLFAPASSRTSRSLRSDQTFGTNGATAIDFSPAFIEQFRRVALTLQDDSRIVLGATLGVSSLLILRRTTGSAPASKAP